MRQSEKEFCEHCGNPFPSSLPQDPKISEDKIKNQIPVAIEVCKNCGASRNKAKDFCENCGEYYVSPPIKKEKQGFKEKAIDWIKKEPLSSRMAKFGKGLRNASISAIKFVGLDPTNTIKPTTKIFSDIISLALEFEIFDALKYRIFKDLKINQKIEQFEKVMGYPFMEWEGQDKEKIWSLIAPEEFYLNILTDFIPNKKIVSFSKEKNGIQVVYYDIELGEDLRFLQQSDGIQRSRIQDSEAIQEFVLNNLRYVKMDSNEKIWKMYSLMNQKDSRRIIVNWKTSVNASVDFRENGYFCLICGQLTSYPRNHAEEHFLRHQTQQLRLEMEELAKNPPPVQCKEYTRNGKGPRCRKMTIDPSGYCTQHNPDIPHIQHKDRTPHLCYISHKVSPRLSKDKVREMMMDHIHKWIIYGNPNDSEETIELMEESLNNRGIDPNISCEENYEILRNEWQENVAVASAVADGTDFAEAYYDRIPLLKQAVNIPSMAEFVNEHLSYIRYDKKEQEWLRLGLKLQNNRIVIDLDATYFILPVHESCFYCDACNQIIGNPKQHVADHLIKIAYMKNLLSSGRKLEVKIGFDHYDGSLDQIIFSNNQYPISFHVKYLAINPKNPPFQEYEEFVKIEKGTLCYFHIVVSKTTYSKSEGFSVECVPISAKPFDLKIIKNSDWDLPFRTLSN